MGTRSVIPLALACLALLLGTADGAAQSPPEPPDASAERPQAGDRIRLVAGTTRLSGTLVSVDEAAVTLRKDSENTHFTVPIETIVRMDVSAGTRSAAGWGALIGGGAGAATGLILGLVEMSKNESGGFGAVGNLSAGEVALGAALVGAVGAGIGAIIGSFSRRDRWESVPLAPSARVGVAPGPGGGVAASLILPFPPRAGLPAGSSAPRSSAGGS